MHILIVSPTFYPSGYFGGPPRAALAFARALRKRGIDVTVYTTDIQDPQKRLPHETLDVDGIHIEYFRNLSNPLTARLNFYAPRGFQKRLRQTIQQFDALHLNEFRNLMGYQAARLAKEHNKPCLLHLRGGLPNIMQHQMLKFLFDQYGGRWMLKNATHVIALQEEEKAQALAAGVEKARIVILPNGVEIPPTIARGTLKSSFRRTADERVLTYIGRLHPEKGLDLLLEALAPFQSQVPFRLLVAGPDFGCEATLRAQAKRLSLAERVEFLGYVDGEKKRELLASTDVFILPSRHEGLPGAALEAMAAALPVLLTTACHLPDLETKQAGFLATVDLEGMTKAVEKMLRANTVDLQRMGKNGRHWMEQDFSWERIVDRALELY